MRELDKHEKGRSGRLGTQPVGDYERLLRHGQFYIGPRVPGLPGDWSTYKISDTCVLVAHPKLNVVQCKHETSTVTLVGYLIDPDNPQRDDKEILRSLVSTGGFMESPFDSTTHLGGRWLLVLQSLRDTFAFADPAGLRQLFYAKDSTLQQLRCASEPGLLAALCDLEVSPEAESFRLSPAFKKNEEYWWPGDSTPFAEMRRLLPNFSISLVTGHCQRFWPTGPFEEMDSGEAVHFIANRLSALMRGIARRGNVLVSITAGLDSRMVLAASRDLTNTLGFMTVQQFGMPSLHADLQIPRRLALHLGFEHEIVNSAPHVRETFRRAYQDSVMHFHEKWLPDAQAIFDAYQQDSLIVVGSMAETGRLFYGGLSSDDSLVPAQLAGVADLGDHPFAVRAFERWLETTRNPYNYSLADLFYWEQRAGRWLATSQLEFGHVWRDIFAPFNSREILSSMLAVDQALRRPPQSVMFRELLSHMWPDVLSEPINPHEATSPASPAVRLARKIRRKLRQYLA